MIINEIDALYSEKKEGDQHFTFVDKSYSPEFVWQRYGALGNYILVVLKSPTLGTKVADQVMFPGGAVYNNLVAKHHHEISPWTVPTWIKVDKESKIGFFDATDKPRASIADKIKAMTTIPNDWCIIASADKIYVWNIRSGFFREATEEFRSILGDGV